MEKVIADIIEMCNQGIVNSKTAGEMFGNLLDENAGRSTVSDVIAKLREC